MGTFTKDQNNIVETLISVFTVNKGDIEVLLIKNKVDPYKGYCVLPGSILNNQVTIEDSITDAVFDQTGLMNVYIEQGPVMSNVNRYPDNRVLAITFLGLVDSTSVEINREERKNIESKWYKLSELPKVGFDHDEIIIRAKDLLRKRIMNINILKSLFPSDFTLPEMQKTFEQVLGKSLDRRNFRKKFVSLDLIEETGEYLEGVCGRPAKLYKFKDNIKQEELF